MPWSPIGSSSLRNRRTRARFCFLCGAHIECLFAPRSRVLARRIGLVNTMVFTHLPSSLFLMAVLLPLHSSGQFCSSCAGKALVRWMCPHGNRNVAAVVKPIERTFASGITNLARSVLAVGSGAAGFLMQVLAFSALCWLAVGKGSLRCTALPIFSWIEGSGGDAPVK